MNVEVNQQLEITRRLLGSSAVVTQEDGATRFTPAEVNRVLGIDWAGIFLPKHRVGNPGGFTELFVRLDRGLYRLK
jgi:hypothetical protein